MPSDGFSIDAHDLDDLAAKLRRAAERAQRDVDASLLRAGEEIKEAAKVIASEHSQKIPPTINMTAMPGTVVITAGDSTSPLAALYELGNRGGKRTSPTFRHPVFGNRDVWVEQPRYRFLAPARAKLRLMTARELTEAWERAMRSTGIHVP